MKKGESLQLKFSWWEAGRPGALASTGLGAALKEYEKNKARHGLALAALDKVEAARLKGIKLCLGPAFDDTRSALKRDAALKTARATHTAALTKALTKLENNLDTVERNIPHAHKFYAAIAKASDDDARKEASGKFNLAAKVIADNQTSADEKITELFQQKAALEPHHAIWGRVTTAKNRLAEYKPEVSRIRQDAQDA